MRVWLLLNRCCMDFALNVWQTLVRAKVDKKHPWRVLTLATGGPDGPDARQVVLRGVNIEQRQITVYTDARSQKMAHIQHNPQVAMLFWDARHQWQLRLWAKAEQEQNEATIEALWATIPEHARKDYATLSAPGQPLPTEPKLPAELNFDQARKHFVVLRFTVQRMDSLVLKREGHERMLLEWAHEQWLQTVLVP